MVSKNDFELLAQILTGQSPQPNATDTACVRSIRTPTGVTMYGFGNKAVYSCDFSRKAVKKGCFANDNSTNKEWASRLGNYIYFIKLKIQGY